MTTKNKINLSLVIFIILIVCFIAFLIFPILKEIKENSEQIIFQKQSLISLEAKTENLERFQTLYQQIKPNLEKIDNLFINPEVPVGFISFLEKIAKDTHISIKISSTLLKKIEKGPWPSLAFQTTSVSPFPNFLKFLEKLETSPYLIEVQSCNISRLTEKGIQLKEFEEFSVGDVNTRLFLKVFTSR